MRRQPRLSALVLAAGLVTATLLGCSGPNGSEAGDADTDTDSDAKAGSNTDAGVVSGSTQTETTALPVLTPAMFPPGSTLQRIDGQTGDFYTPEERKRNFEAPHPKWRTEEP